jgi:hypothetical protein
MFRLAVLILACFGAASGCAQPNRTAKISEDFQVCMNADRGAVYAKSADGPDYDVGVLTIGKAKLDVYIGYSVGLKKGDWSRVEKPNNGFVLLGTEIDGKTKKTMLGHRRQSRGPLLVLFVGPNDPDISSVLESQNFIQDCEHGVQSKDPS